MKNIKTTILTGLVFLSHINLIAQIPESFKYQAVVRDASGNVFSNLNLDFRIGILEGTNTTIIYSELHNATTNNFGLVNLEIGTGTVQSGQFSEIEWDITSYFIAVEMKESGASNYDLLGTSELLSVPYALFAKNVVNSDDADADSTNELQQISKTGLDVQLSKGGGTISIADGDTSLWKLQGNDINYSAGEVSVGNVASSPNNNSFVIEETIGSNDPIASEHNLQFEIRNGIKSTGSGSSRAFSIGVLDDGTSVMYAHERSIGYNNIGINPDPNGGSVGIGTAAPQKTLHVFSNNADYNLKLESASGHRSGIEFVTDQSSWETDFQFFNTAQSNPFAMLRAGGGGGDAAIRLFTRTASANVSPIERMRIDEAGNVGIGTSLPQNLLHVQQGGTNSTTIAIDQSGTGGHSWHVNSTGSANASGAGNFIIRDDDQNADRLLIDGNGNVGVNNTNPQRALHVNDVLRLEPRNTAPSSPSAGDMYFDSTINKLRVYDGTVWQDVW